MIAAIWFWLHLIKLFRRELYSNINSFKSSLYYSNDVYFSKRAYIYIFVQPENTFWIFLILSKLCLQKFFKYRKKIFSLVVEMWQKTLRHTLFLKLCPYQNTCGSGSENLNINSDVFPNFWYMKFVCNLSTQHNVIIIYDKSINY